jgi:hypothetical protein
VALALFTRYCHCGRLPACTTCQVYVSNVQETRYHVIGAEMQVVNVELKPGDSKLCNPPPRERAAPNLSPDEPLSWARSHLPKTNADVP